ncbi:MAG: sugar phosphate isomerase/epimerase [Anaerolineae bacterium]|nr:sugar phosphate isomerase/epimerase [Anaerolineae bacterium]
MAKKRQLGVCTWTFGEQPLATTAETLARLGFDGVELLGDLSLYSAEQAARILDDQGLAVFSLTPANVDISHPDALTRQAAVDYYYELIDFAAALGEPLISCHGLVGRIAPLATMDIEDHFLRDSVRKIGARAGEVGLRVVFEVLNRYESHQINNHAQALDLVARAGLDNLGILLDAYHMNIEEAAPAAALATAGEALWLYHAGDSNREGIGHGHTDFRAQLRALDKVGYDGPIVLECAAPGPNPFTPDKGGEWRATLESYLADSRHWLVESFGTAK